MRSSIISSCVGARVQGHVFRDIAGDIAPVFLPEQNVVDLSIQPGPTLARPTVVRAR
jgi:hypothetical protein